MLNDEEVVYIERIDKTSGVKLTTTLRVGSRRPIHADAIGKVIRAFLPESDQRRILDHLYSADYPGKTFCSKSEFVKQLQNIRRLGYSANKSELFQDILALAVSILNHQSLPVAGINIVLPRITPQNQIKKIHPAPHQDTEENFYGTWQHGRRFFRIYKEEEGKPWVKFQEGRLKG